MPKPYIKYKIISSSRSWDICYESVNGRTDKRTDKRTRWLQYSPHSMSAVRLRIFHVCHNENFRNSYLSFYWKKWFYIWYMALAWWLVPCLPFPGLPQTWKILSRTVNRSRCAVNLERGNTVQVIMPKPYIKYKIISSSRSRDIRYESVNGRTNGQTRWLQYSPLSMRGGIINIKSSLIDWYKWKISNTNMNEDGWWCTCMILSVNLFLSWI
jgi:hypothetical protein